MSVAVLARSLLCWVLELFWKLHLGEADKKSRIYSVLQTSQLLLFVSSGQLPRTDPFVLFLFHCFWISRLGNFFFFSHNNFWCSNCLVNYLILWGLRDECTPALLESCRLLTINLKPRLPHQWGSWNERAWKGERTSESALGDDERKTWLVYVKVGMMREGLGWLGMVRERVGRLGMVREAMAGLVRGASWLLALGSRSSVDVSFSERGEVHVDLVVGSCSGNWTRWKWARVADS